MLSDGSVELIDTSFINLLQIAMSFTSVEARAALIDILSAFQSQTNLPGLEAARAEAGNDMVKQMQLVFPAVTRIQAQVISRYVIQCWIVGAIFTFGRSRMFEPEKLRPLAVAEAVGLKISNHSN